jgi:outer membrane protein
MTQSRLVHILAAVALAAALAQAGAAAAQQGTAASGKVGYVNTERVMREARLPVQLKQNLEAEFQKRDREISAGKPEDVERRRRSLAEEMVQRRDDAQKQLIEKANGVIRRIALQENFDAVFVEAAYADKRIDITDRVIKALDAER